MSTTANLPNFTTDLDPWEPCSQCKIIGVSTNNETQYTGTFSDKYLECSKCNLWTHPICDSISDNEAGKIDTYFCKKCRSRTRKITYKADDICEYEETDESIYTMKGTTEVTIHNNSVSFAVKTPQKTSKPI